MSYHLWISTWKCSSSSMQIYPVWLSRFIFSFALICIFNIQPQARSHLVKVGAGVMMSHFRRTEIACCFLCFMYWLTILILGSSPHDFICTWNNRSISTDWLWIMIVKKKCRLICCVPRFLLWRWQFVAAVWHPKNLYTSILTKWYKAIPCVFNVNARGGSGDSGNAELGTKAALSFIPFLDLRTGIRKSKSKNCRISQYLP